MPKISRKRKPPAVNESSKLVKVDGTSLKKTSSYLRGIVSGAQVDPLTIHNMLQNQNLERDLGFEQARVLYLTKIFYAIGSPDVFGQLCDACSSVRQGVFQLADEPKGVDETMKALDRLEGTQHLAYISRRYLLSSLARKHRDLGHLTVTSDRPRRVKRNPPSDIDTNIRLQRADEVALAKLITETWPDLKVTPARSDSEYNRKKSSLRERLKAGRKWLMMVEKFDVGILALVPTHGDYDISNRE